MDSTEDVTAIMPQERAITFELNAYFSTITSVREDSLKANKYRSSRLNILGVGGFLYLPFLHLIRIFWTQKPPDAPKNFPDYSTFLVRVCHFKHHVFTSKYSQIFVEDSPPAAQTAGSPEYDDS